MADLAQAIQNMVDLCNDDSHGYDQGSRWGPDYDCSSSIVTSLRNAGFDTGGASTTSNMVPELTARGWQQLDPSVEKEPGDILITPGSHTALYIGDGQLAEFSSNEHGGITGGQTGDQTGREGWVHSYYNFPWSCVLRWPEGINKLTLLRWIPA